MTTHATPKPVLLDVDTGIDDAMAIAAAVRCPTLEVLAITTVAGNVAVPLTTDNTLRVLSLLGRDDIPVHRGMAGPLVRDLRHAAHFHGENGLGGFEPPAPRRGVQPSSAPEAIIQAARARPGELTLICVAPLTNLAVALSLEPDLPRLVRKVVVMGGAFAVPGNVTPYAEFNAYCDPEAAAIVARSGLPLAYLGLDVTHQVALTMEQWRALEGASAPEAVLVREVTRQALADGRRDHLFLHDPLAVGVALDPTLVTTQSWSVVVDTTEWETRGQTRLALDPSAPQHEVALRVDAARFLQWFWHTLHLPHAPGSPVSQDAARRGE